MPVARRLSASEGPALARALGDTPGTVIPTHALRRGLARAYVVGDLPEFRAALVQRFDAPTEPMGFGSEPDALVTALLSARGWGCVEVAPPMAEPVGRTIAARTGWSGRLYGGPAYRLDGPLTRVRHPWVRRLGPRDAAILENAPRSLRGGGWGSLDAQLGEGINVGALFHGRLVALASVTSVSVRYADIGVATDPEFRGRGLATAAAAVVAEEARGRGRTPVWSTGADNRPSNAIARRLGFREDVGTVYVVVDALKGRGYDPERRS